MNLTPRDYVTIGLTVAGALCGVAAAVAAVPTGWNWAAFFGAASTACGALGVAWGKLTAPKA